MPRGLINGVDTPSRSALESCLAKPRVEKLHVSVRAISAAGRKGRTVEGQRMRVAGPLRHSMRRLIRGYRRHRSMPPSITFERATVRLLVRGGLSLLIAPIFSAFGLHSQALILRLEGSTRTPQAGLPAESRIIGGSGWPFTAEVPSVGNSPMLAPASTGDRRSGLSSPATERGDCSGPSTRCLCWEA